MCASSQFEVYPFHNGSSARWQIMNHENMEVYSQIGPQSYQLLPEKNQILSLRFWAAEISSCTPALWFSCLCAFSFIMIFDVSHGKFSFSSFIVTWIHTPKLGDGALHGCDAGFWEGRMRPGCVFQAPAIPPTGTHTLCWDYCRKMHKPCAASVWAFLVWECRHRLSKEGWEQLYSHIHHILCFQCS